MGHQKIAPQVAPRGLRITRAKQSPLENSQGFRNPVSKHHGPVPSSVANDDQCPRHANPLRLASREPATTLESTLSVKSVSETANVQEGYGGADLGHDDRTTPQPFLATVTKSVIVNE